MAKPSILHDGLLPSVYAWVNERHIVKVLALLLDCCNIIVHIYLLIINYIFCQFCLQS